MKLLQQKLASYTEPQKAKAAGIYPYFRAISSEQDTEVIINGKKVLMFGSNCYSGLVNDPRVREAAIQATMKYGTGLAGSPFLNGTLDIHKDLEKKLEGGRFDLVSIDAPIGGDMKCLSRVDLHRIAPKALADEFVVLMDDTERKPEMDSMIELHRILLEAGISCSYATYDGMKECMVLASDSLKYLLTL